jgi:phosphate transport system protein
VRDAYHDDLDALTQSLIDMTHLVGSAVGRATQALLDADVALAEQVISGDKAVDALYQSVEEQAFELLARQQPVAVDLRRVVASLRMMSDLERSGDLAAHVAELARRRYPASAIPAELQSTILEMGQMAQRITAKAGSVIASQDLELCNEIERDDDVMDGLHRKLFRALLEDEWKGTVEEAVDITLCSRYYERLADHAVSVARRIVYLVTGRREVGSKEFQQV